MVSFLIGSYYVLQDAASNFTPAPLACCGTFSVNSLQTKVGIFSQAHKSSDLAHMHHFCVSYFGVSNGFFKKCYK